MTAKEITKLNGKEFNSLNSANEAINNILQLSGVREKRCTDYMDFITLDKNVLLNSGVLLYAIWIKKTYNNENKKVFIISQQTDYSMSMTIKPYINEAVRCGTVVLLDETKQQLKSIN